MDALLSKVLGTFAVGLLVTAAVVLYWPLADSCGSVAGADSSCPGYDGRLTAVIVLVGSALTAGAARLRISWSGRG